MGTTALELRQLAGRVGAMTIAEAEAACALASEAIGYGMPSVRGSSIIASVIRYLLDAADTVELRAYAAATKAKALEEASA